MATRLTRRKVVRLHPKQYEFRHSPALYRAFCGGRGAGKTFAGAYDLIRRAERGRVYMAVGPTYTSLRDSTMRTFIKVARELGVLDAESLKMSSPPHLTLTTGAEILFRSGDDPERLRGPSLSGAWLDEASLMPRAVYDVMIATLRDDGRQGWMSATFTPKGPTSWVHEVFATGRPDTAIIRSPTAMNPFLPPEFTETIRRQYDPQYARQELDAEFVSLAGAAFPPFYFEGDIYFTDWPAALAWRVIAGDPSTCTTKGGDYWAYAVVGMVTPANVFYVDAVLEREAGAVQMITRGLDLCRSFGPVDLFVLESNQGLGLLREEVKRQCEKRQQIVPYAELQNVTNKEERIRNRLGAYLDQRRFRFRKTRGCELLVNQMRDFPFSEFDDGADALELAIRCLEQILNR